MKHSAHSHTTPLVALAAMLSLPLILNAQSSSNSSRMNSSSGTYNQSNDQTLDRNGSDMNSRSSSSELQYSDKRFLTKASEDNQKEIAFAQLAAQQASNDQVRSFAQQLVTDHQQVASELTQLAQNKGVELARSGTGFGSRGSYGATNSGSTRSSDRTSAGVNIRRPTGTASSGSDTSQAGSGMGASAGSSSGTYSPASSGTGTTSGSYASKSSTGNSGSADLNGLGWSGRREYRQLSDKNGQDFDQEFLKQMVQDHQKAVDLYQDASSNARDSDVKSFAARNLPALRNHLERAQSLQQNNR